MSRPFRPSSGSMGEWFESKFCAICERDIEVRKNADYEKGCQIYANVLFLEIDHAEYPKEWIYDDDDEPVCTAFILEGEEIPYRCAKTLSLPLGG